MPVYDLRPIDLSHADWMASTHKDVCRIHAIDGRQARQIASLYFGIATKKTTPGDPISTSPWSQSERVECKEVRDYEPNKYTEGEIEVPDPEHRYSTIGEVPKISDLADFDGLVPFKTIHTPVHQSGATPDYRAVRRSSSWATGESDVDEEPIGSGPISADALDYPSPDAATTAGFTEQEIVARVLENKVRVKAQTACLLMTLEDVFRDELSDGVIPNASLPVLWLSEDDAQDQELRDLLTQIRDELRRLNDALESAAPDEGTLSRVAAALAPMTVAFMKGFGATAGTGAGFIFTALLVTLLTDVEAIDPAIMDTLAAMLEK